MHRSLIFHRQVTLIGQDSFVLGALATHLKAHAMLKCVQLPSIYSSVKKDLHNIPTHCDLDYVPLNNPLKSQNCVVMCPKDEMDTFEAAKWYALNCTDENSVPPLFILCENVNFTTVLSSLVVKKYISQQCAHTVAKSVIGIPTFTIYRTRGFLANTCRRNPYDIDLNIAVGATPTTSVPLTAAIGHHFGLRSVDLQDVTRRSQNYPLKSSVIDKTLLRPEETFYSPFSQNSPLSTAFAGFEFIISFLRAQRGDSPATEVVFTEQFTQIEEKLFDEKTPLPQFLSRRAVIDQPGLVKLHDYGKLSSFEQDEVQKCIPMLQADIQKATDAFERLSN